MDLDSPIDRREIITLLCDLISIKSVNPAYEKDSSEREIGEFIKGFLRQNKIAFEVQEVFPDRFNIVAELDGQDQNSCLLFEAHMDTASAENMSIEAFRPEVKNNLVYGRGACDTKAGLAAMLYSIKLVKELGLQPQSNILFAATVDEEYSFRGIWHLIRAGVKANGAIISEPTELNVVVAHKGCLRWRIMTKGKAAHSSKAHLGVNAILKMMKIIQAFESKLQRAYEEKRHPLVGSPTFNVGLITGGVQVNIVPDSCVIEIDRRTVPGENRDSVWREFNDLLDELTATDPELEVSMEEPMLEDFPLDTATDQRVVIVVQDACRKVLGKARPEGVPYGTNASKLSRAGIPSVVLGPGSIDQAHTADEFVHVDQVLKAIQIYTQTMLNF